MSTNNAAPTTAPAAAPTETPAAEPTLTGGPMIPSMRRGAAAKAANPPVKPAEPAPEAPKPPTAAEIKKWKLRTGETEREVDEAELLKLASKASGADARFQAAAAERARLEQVLDLVKSDPAQAMALLGLNPREFAEQFLGKELAAELESPEQRQRRVEREELEQHRAAEKQRKADADRQHLEQRTAVAREQLDGLLTGALKESGLAPSKRVVARAAGLARILLKQGNTLDATAASAVGKMLREEFTADLHDLIKGQDPEALENFLGEDVWSKLSKHKIKKLKSEASTRYSTPSTQTTSRNEQNQQPKGTWRALVKRNRGFSG